VTTTEQQVESELDALTRVILKGVSPGTWQPRHVDYQDVATVVDCLKAGMSRAQTVREAIRTRRRRVDNSGQVTEPETPEAELIPGDPAGLGGPVLLPHDEHDIHHDCSDLKPRPQVVKVGPKGYSHGWVKVGVEGGIEAKDVKWGDNHGRKMDLIHDSGAKLGSVRATGKLTGQWQYEAKHADRTELGTFSSLDEAKKAILTYHNDAVKPVFDRDKEPHLAGHHDYLVGAGYPENFTSYHGDYRFQYNQGREQARREQVQAESVGQGIRSLPVPGAAKNAADPHDANPVEAEHVMNQMRHNYPEKALGWMATARWIGPIEVPQDRIDYDDVDSWAASHQGARVKEFAKQIKKGKGHTHPVVAVQEPGENRVKVIDGHHRTLAYQRLKKPIRAYVGFVDSDGGPWDQTHVYQENQGASPANKAKGHGGDAETLRQYWSHGEGAAKIRWGEPGDFERCVQHVGKYMADPEGYCNLRHHDALGIYPATHASELSGKSATPGLTKRSGMVSIDLPAGLIESVPGGVGDHHVTLAYLGSDVSDDTIDDVIRTVKHVAKTAQPFTMTVSGVDTFLASDSSEGKVPVFAPVELTPELAALREPFAQYHASEHQDFHPHVTLTYQEEGEDLPEPVPVTEVPVTSVSVHLGGVVVARVILGGGDLNKTAKLKIPKIQILKVGPEGYVHGFICVRPPCGHGTTKAWRDPKNGKVYHGGHLEGKNYVGGTQIGGIRKNADGTFSGQHNGAIIGSGKMKLQTKHATHQGAVDSVAEYHNLHLLAQHAAKHDGSAPAAHLHAAANALAAGDTHKAHDELVQASHVASGGPSHDSVDEQLQAHDQLHGVGTTHQDYNITHAAKKTLPSAPPKPVKGVAPVQHPAPAPLADWEKQLLADEGAETEKPTAPTTAWAKAGSEINTTDLSVKANGDVVHKPTNTVVGTLTKQVDTPKKGSSTFTATHADGTQTHVGVYKGNALASIALHHNSKMTGGEGHPAQPGSPTVSTAFLKPQSLGELPSLTTPPSIGVPHQQPALPAKVTVNSLTAVPGSNGFDYIHDNGMKIGETVPGGQIGSYAQVKHVNGTVLDVKHTTSTGAPLPGTTGAHAKLTLTEYHNSLNGASSSPVVLPTVPKKDYEKLGAINPIDVKADGAGDFVYQPTGTVVGHYKQSGNSFIGTHEDGTTVPQTGNQSTKEAVVAYHNKKYAGVTEMTTPAEAPKPEAPTWVKAGTAVKPSNVSVKQDGTNAAIDKASKQQIGTVTKKAYGGWMFTHEDGTHVGYNLGTKKEAVQALANYHNQSVAVNQAVTLKQGGDLAKLDPGNPKYGYNTQMTQEGEVTHHTSPWKSDEDVVTYLGTVKPVSGTSDTFTVTHTPSGATWTTTGAAWDGKSSLAYGHKQAVDRAAGTTVAPPKPKTPLNFTPVPPAPPKVPASAYTNLGSETLSASELAAVKKYTGSWYSTINSKLATGKVHHDAPTGNPSGDQLTSALSKSNLTQDLELHRGINNGAAMLGEVGSHVGKVGIQHSFMSTSTKEHVGKGFGGWGSKGLLLTVHAPKGAQGMDVKGVSYYGNEAEILFQRGTMYHVNSDAVDPSGTRRADITLIGLSSATGNHTLYPKMGSA